MRVVSKLLFGCVIGVCAVAQTSVEMPKVSPQEYRGDVRLLSTWPMPVTPLRANKPEREGPRPNKIEDPRNLPALSAANLPVILAPMPAASSSFAGLSLSDPVTGGQAGSGYPPDTNGDVGPKHYILGVNDSYAIYDKATGSRLAAFTENALWNGVGNTKCNGNAFGDPIVLYDAFADRWILTHFAFTLASNGDIQSGTFQCIAASKTNDPVNGGWYLYALQMDPGTTGTPSAGALADYPKFGIWTDCMYMGANVFNAAGTAYLSPLYASFSRADLYSGAPLTWSMIYPNSAGVFSSFPAHTSGKTPASRPPAGRPAIFVGESSSVFGWETRTFTPGTNCGAGGVLSAVTTATHPSYSFSVNRVPQPGTTQTIESLTDRLMNRPFYRKVGNTESIWVTNSTRNTGQVFRVHWSQLNVTGGTLPTTLVQDAFHGDTVSTGLHRWMGSVAADNQGNMAVGYSTSNATSPNFPSIRYAGRLASDTANTLPQTETTLIAGTGSQTSIERWGDYASMSVDPVDDCTFWFTSEYYITTGTNWNTRIGSFKFPTCTAPTAGANLTISKSHVGNFALGQSNAQYTITVSNTGDAPSFGPVTVTDTVPAGLTATNLSGTGWTCTQPSGPCMRTDALANGSSYPALTLTVNVAANAASSVTNIAEVSGGSDMVLTGNTSSDITTIVPALPAPTVVSYQVLNGTQSYDLVGSSRVRLPWTAITAIRVRFSTVITTATAASLSGLSATAVSGVGTDTLTWTLASPLPLGNVSTSLAGTGPAAISGPGGPLTTYNRNFKVLPGDFNDDGVVNSPDMTAVNNARVAAYNVLADINGSGAIDITDVTLVRARIGTVLP